MDIFERIKSNPGPLGRYSDVAEGYYIFPRLEGPLGPRMKFNGKEVIVWSVNNYLGLANHPEVRQADAEAAADWGMAYPMGSRMMSGNTEYHAQLEDELAEFVSKPAALLVNFGYQAVFSAIDALVSRNDVIVYDSACHACIVDGVRLHIGNRFVFEHNDMSSLEKMLIRANEITKKTKGGILVISEGVFGMRGMQGDLKGICALKEKYDFRLLVDDAHGFGTLGATGAGAGEEQGVQDQIDIYFSTFAKSMAGIGAFFAADPEVIHYLKYNIRSQIFAKSLPMPFVMGSLKRLDLIRRSPELKNKLWDVVNKLQSGLRERGFNLGVTQSCVTPVILSGTVAEATYLVEDLRDNFGIFCSIVIYPVVPKGVLLLRLIPTAAHTDEDIEVTLDAFTEVAAKLKAGEYNHEKVSARTISARPALT
ncbi:MAG: aminotransferase class I/II-fold pyridoxal phosphate-dependent enzyme [Saprospiraceae bacterium]|nr:aminotransferase class I/II-fold pyridoxal phosphate-dependent enzyme [Saprospiraceae bacterium]